MVVGNINGMRYQKQMRRYCRSMGSNIYSRKVRARMWTRVHT